MLFKTKKQKKLYDPFLWEGFNFLKAWAISRKEISQKFPVYTHCINLRQWKDESNLEPPGGLEHGTPGLGIGM